MERFIKGILLFSIILAIFCHKKNLIEANRVDDQFEIGKKLFEQKDYDKAIKAFERVIYYFATGEYTDDAQFYLALCYFKKKEYELAKSEFEFLIENFPQSEYVEQSYIYIAKCILNKNKNIHRDLSQIKDAIKILREFLSKFPKSKYRNEAKELLREAKERLAQKMLLAIKVYYKLGKKESALLYYELLKNEYPESEALKEAKRILNKWLKEETKDEKY